MILLFGPKANKTGSSQKNNNVKNHPVENSGVLAMNLSNAKSLMTMGEYDTYISSSPVVINFALYANCESTTEDSGFMSDFSAAVALLGDGAGYSDGGYSDCGSCCSASCGSFSSVG